MAPKHWLVFTLLAMVMVVESSPSTFDDAWGMSSLSSSDDIDDIKVCKGQLGDCIEPEDELMLDSESSRRQLGAYSNMFISYSVLKKNQIPCSQRGASYYNCRGNRRANPYRRGCTAISHCKRYTK